jgi:hypothetical protein
MKIKNIVFNLFVIITVLSNLIISTSFHNIALSFEQEFDEKGFISNSIKEQNVGDDFFDDSIAKDLISFDNEEPFSLNAKDIKKGDLVSCTNYPKLGNVSVNISLNQDNFEPGKDLLIEGDVVNNNLHPVVDTSIYARLVKNLDDSENIKTKTIILDEFVLASDINLNSGDSYRVNSKYLLPDTLSSGDYKLLLYVYSNDQFNLAGITYSDLFYANSIPFNIEGDSIKNIYIDTNSTTINGQVYDGSLIQNDIGEVNIEANLVNESDETKEVKISYQLYHWDSTFQDNLIQSREENYTINPGQKTPIKYTLDNASNPVYELKITSSSPQNNKSISNIRFATNNTFRPRIDFVGLDSYPITKDSKIITCIHNTGPDIDNGPIKIVTSLKNSRNIELGRIEYSGPISSQIEGIASKVKSLNLTEVITLESVLYNNQGVEIDRITINYDCNKINPEICNQIKNSLININLIIIIVIILLVIILKWSHIKHYIIKNK